MRGGIGKRKCETFSITTLCAQSDVADRWKSVILRAAGIMRFSYELEGKRRADRMQKRKRKIGEGRMKRG